MAILANRAKIQNNLVDLSKFIFFSTKKFFVCFLILAACYILYFPTSGNLTKTLIEITGRTLSAADLVYTELIQAFKWGNNRLSYFKNLETENLELKFKLSEFEKLKQTSLRTELENKALKKILNVTKDIKYKFITAKIVGVSITPFASNATINAGEANGLQIDDIVKGEKGLIGRISEIGTNYSTVTMIGDHNFRIPVITSNSRVKGILAKQNDQIKMIYLQENHTVKKGEILYSSGDGRVYPKDIAVAVIESTSDESAVVRTIEDLNQLEFVMVESKLH